MASTTPILINENISSEIQNFTVDTSFLDFLGSKSDSSKPKLLPKDAESRIRGKIEADFNVLESAGATICGKIHSDISTILQTERKIQKKMRQNLIISLKEFMVFYKSIGLPPSQILSFPVTPYFHPRAQTFIEAAKFGKTDRLKVIIEKEANETFVYEYDHLLLTALHWAVKRNHTRAAEYLIQANSFVNAVDIFGRPPLYYAIDNKNAYLCYHLLIRLATPWSCRDCDYLEMCKSSPEIFSLIKRFRRADIYLRLVKYKDKENVRKRIFGKMQEPKMPMA
jgi:hypothetical protein